MCLLEVRYGDVEFFCMLSVKSEFDPDGSHYSPDVVHNVVWCNVVVHSVALCVVHACVQSAQDIV